MSQNKNILLVEDDPDIKELISQISLFIQDSKENIFLKKLNAIKKCKNYTLFNHFNSLTKLLNDT